MDSPAASPKLAASSSPNRSRASSRAQAAGLTLDLSSLPPLTSPAVPSNTLLLTNLQNPSIFTEPNLTALQSTISTHAPLASWSPLKSFRRIVCSFHSVSDAIAVRSALDGTNLLGDRIRVYFGEDTPLRPVDNHLTAPAPGKLFFISPPPSPPLGWESREEEPPNDVMLAEDLKKALERLRFDTKAAEEELVGVEGKEATGFGKLGRPRSASSVVLFEPEEKGSEMPAVTVEDYSEGESSPVITERPLMVHTARPPVELMGDA